MCWVNKQYYVPFNKSVPADPQQRMSISYYRWVPLIILAQGMVFFSTGVIWRIVHGRVGFSLGLVVQTATSCKQSLDVEARKKIIMYLVRQIDEYLVASRSFKKGWCINLKKILAEYCCLVCGKVYGNYLTCSYLLIKVMYIFNNLIQLFVLDYFLGYNKTYYFYGFHILISMIQGLDWEASDRFPRVILCDFNIRQHNNLHRYTLQCALPINLFNEKMFTFIWFLLFVLAVVTFVNLLHWMSKTVIISQQTDYIKRELRSMNLQEHEFDTVKKFAGKYLRRDGLLILRLISKNAGDIIAAEILHGLWLNFLPNSRGKKGTVIEMTDSKHKKRSVASHDIV